MYAIVKTGGKQYRVEEGQILRVERLEAASGQSVTLEEVLFLVLAQQRWKVTEARRPFNNAAHPPT